MESFNVNVYFYFLVLLISFPPCIFVVPRSALFNYILPSGRNQGFSVSYHLKLGFYDVTIVIRGKSLVMPACFLSISRKLLTP